MDTMELGTIGELVGGVAVIGSLIFVGIPIRGNTRASAAAARNAWLTDYHALLLSTRNDPEWMKGNQRASNANLKPLHEALPWYALEADESAPKISPIVPS